MVIVEEIEKVDLLQGNLKESVMNIWGIWAIRTSLFTKRPDKRTHHVHIYQFDNTQEILRHLAFRNYLRENPAIATTYGTLKAIGPSTPR